MLKPVIITRNISQQSTVHLISHPQPDETGFLSAALHYQIKLCVIKYPKAQRYKRNPTQINTL